jgi:hypothetical protein
MWKAVLLACAWLLRSKLLTDQADLASSFVSIACLFFAQIAAAESATHFLSFALSSQVRC